MVMIMNNTLAFGAVVATITAWIKLHRNQPSWLCPPPLSLQLVNLTPIPDRSTPPTRTVELWLPLRSHLMRTDTGDGGVEARHHLVIATTVGVMQPRGAAVGCRHELRWGGGQQVQ